MTAKLSPIHISPYMCYIPTKIKVRSQFYNFQQKGALIAMENNTFT